MPICDVTYIMLTEFVGSVFCANSHKLNLSVFCLAFRQNSLLSWLNITENTDVYSRAPKIWDAWEFCWRPCASK